MPAGVYTLSGFAKYSADYDGEKVWTHARFFDEEGTDVGHTNTNEEPDTAPTAPDEYQYIAQTFHSPVALTSIHWYVGYPGLASRGFRYITRLQITAPDGTALIPDGEFANGGHLDSFEPGQSYGENSIEEDCDLHL